MTFFATVSAILLLSPLIAFLYRNVYLPNFTSLEQQADRAERIWKDEMRAVGYTSEEIYALMRVRTALATIQEDASDAVYRNDGDIDKQMNESAMIEIMALGDKSPAGRALINVLKETPKDELLHPDALHELERQYKRKERARPEGWSPTKVYHGSPSKAETDRQALIRLNAYNSRG
jgi:hypothetical protein